METARGVDPKTGKEILIPTYLFDLAKRRDLKTLKDQLLNSEAIIRAAASEALKERIE